MRAGKRRVKALGPKKGKGRGVGECDFIDFFFSFLLFVSFGMKRMMMTGQRVARDGTLTLVGWFECDDAGTVRLVWMTKQGRSRSDGKRVADSISASGYVLPEASITYATQHMHMETIADTTYEADEAIRKASHHRRHCLHVTRRVSNS